jgi:hypothetical protein
MVTQANNYENVLTNKAYEDIADLIAQIDGVIDNGSTPTFGEIETRATALMPEDRKHWLRDDDSTGFDSPIQSVIGYDNFRRRSSNGFNVVFDARKKPTATADVIVIDVDGSMSVATTVVWMDEAFWPSWFAYQQEAWTNARLIDARHLTNGEVLVLRVLVDHITRRTHASTRATPIIRATVEQCMYMIDRQLNGNKVEPWCTYLPAPIWKDPKDANKIQPVECYRAYAEPQYIEAGERVLKALEGLTFDFYLAAKLVFGR